MKRTCFLSVIWMVVITLTLASKLLALTNVTNHISLLLTGSYPRITFIEGPEDLYISVGEDAAFNCIYSGTLDLPAILINGEYRTADSLPPRAKFEFMRLKIANVQLSDNNTRIQCTFPGVFSSIGHIRINSTGVQNCTTDYSSRTQALLSSSSPLYVSTTSDLASTATSVYATFDETTTVVSTLVAVTSEYYLSNTIGVGVVLVGVFSVLAAFSLIVTAIIITFVCRKLFCKKSNINDIEPASYTKGRGQITLLSFSGE